MTEPHNSVIARIMKTKEELETLRGLQLAQQHIEQALLEQVDKCRELGCTWEQIADVMKLPSRQYAQRRFGKKAQR